MSPLRSGDFGPLILILETYEAVPGFVTLWPKRGQLGMDTIPVVKSVALWFSTGMNERRNSF